MFAGAFGGEHSSREDDVFRCLPGAECVAQPQADAEFLVRLRAVLRQRGGCS
jgi:hypothetical protein